MALNDNNLNLLNFKNCKRCGKPFSTVLQYTICPACMEEENKRFNRTRDYIYSTPLATEEDITNACDITKEELMRWIREEKIQLAEDSPISYPCESCGTKIRRGHFCLDCKIALQSKSTRKENTTKSGISMHYFTNN